MFGDRSLRVRMVKDEEPKPSPPTDYEAVTKKAVEGVVALLAIYMGMDTLRKVIIHAANVKIR